MTTATEAPTEAGRLAALRAAEARLEEARREHAQLDGKARAWSDGVARAQAELDRVARAEPGQFGDGGRPRPKTAAARLKRKIDGVKTGSLPAMVAGAEDRVREREAEVRRLTRPVAPELCRARWDEDLEAIREALALRDQLLGVIGRINASVPALAGIANAVRGLNGSNVSVDPGWQEVERVLLGARFSVNTASVSPAGDPSSWQSNAVTCRLSSRVIALRG